MDFDVTTRNARADATETSIGASPTIHFYTGAKPANCAAADPAGELYGGALPADWLAAAASGAKAIANGPWNFVATAAGTAASFRIKDSGGTCRIQGTCSLAGGGGDMIMSNTNLALAQAFAVTAFTMTEGNAGA